MTRVMDRLRQFRDDRAWDDRHSVRNLSMALNVEASEILQLMQWVHDAEFDDWIAQKKNKKKLADEIADVFIYLAYLADYVGVDMEKAVASKIERNEKRFPKSVQSGSGNKNPKATA